MPGPRRSLTFAWLLALAAIIATSAWLAGRWAEQRALAQLSIQAGEQLQLRALALQRLIDRYRVLPAVMALDPQLRSALTGPSTAIDSAQLNHKMELANGATHASTLTLIDRHGLAVAANNWREPSSNVGLHYAFRPYFQQAMQTGHGTFYAIGVSTNVAGYFIAEAVNDEAGQRVGVMVVKITLDTLAREWRQSDGALLLSDEHDIVFLSNRPGWLYRPLHPLTPATAAALAATRQYGAQAAPPSRYSLVERLDDGSARVRFDDRALGGDVLWRSLDLPAQHWRIHLLSDVHPAVIAGRNAALIMLGGWLPVILLGLFLQQRIRLTRWRQRSREELERMVAHYTSELRSAQDGLVLAARQAAQGHHSSLEHLPQGVAVVDAELRLVAWNRRYAQIFGFPPELLQAGRPIEDLFRHNARRGLLGAGNTEESIQRRLDYLRQGSPHMYERERPDGSVLEIRGNPLPDGGFVTSYADITTYKTAARDLRTLASTLEERIQESTRDLRAAKAEADRANRYKTRYVAAAVHDLMQPLNAARLFAGALRQQLRAADERELLERVEHALQAQDSLLTSMLDISRLDAGALKPTLTSFALSPLLQGLARQFGIVAQAHALRLSLVDTRCWVHSDAALLRRALQNFLSNAMHYTPRGRVLLGCRRRGQHLRIEVWDTGVGIAANKRQAIFREFHRLDNGLHGEERNAGLGLSIVERLARLLHHPLHLHSQPGRGSMFAISVPLAEPPRVLPAPPARDSNEDSPLRGRHVLSIEADPASQVATIELLRSWGCRTSAADNPDDALALARAEPAPDLIVLDCAFGPALLEALRAGRAEGGPVIVLSARTDSPARAPMSQAGLRVIDKPISPARLRALLSQLLTASTY